MPPLRRTHPRTIALGVAALLVLVLYGAQIIDARDGALRTVGIVISTAPSSEPGIAIERVGEGGPAEAGGLRAGDRILEVNGLPIVQVTDYDVAASTFSPEKKILFRVDRNGRRLALGVLPGVPVDWSRIGINGFQLLSLLALAILATSRAGDLRALLMATFSLLVALEIALPSSGIGTPVLSIISTAVFYLLTGAQMGVELHLAALIPERPDWLKRRRWIIPTLYVVGLGLGVLTFATHVIEELGDPGGLLPWTSDEIARILFQFGFPTWAVLLVTLLALPTFRHPEPQKRHQAGLVLLGMLPWALYAFFTSIPGLLAQETIQRITDFLPLILLCYPAAVFVAIFRYHLFDLEKVVRKSMVYTILTSTLLLVFYGALGAGGALFSKLLGGERDSVWVVSSATLILGLLFSPLRRRVQAFIDRRMYPEREALHRRLTGLAGELPALGRMQLMGQHLVDRCSEIFQLRSTTLLLSDPSSGFLVTLAAHPSTEHSGLTLLLSPDDPGIRLLRDSPTPLPVAEVAGVSPALMQRLQPFHARYLAAMKSQDDLVGVLILGAKADERPYRKEELELLGFLAHHVGTVFENVRLFQSATYEGLTGLRRREAILELLDQELQRAIRYERPLTVALADLDHFKSINDRYGHLAGDALLKRVARELEDGLRGTDAIGRYGGEEFLLVFPETDLEGASRVSEKIRMRMEDVRVRMDDETEVGVRISIGVASIPPGTAWESGNTSRQLIQRADQALYKAKASGRNRVESAIA